jgi:SAM-dependent methyltransferase
VGQEWDAEAYERNAAFVAELGEPLLALLAPRAGERVLDLGCGDGRLTLALRQAGCVVVGVDASASQVEAAQRRGLDARVMDGEVLDFDREFDAVFSNAALHWMKRPDLVLQGVWKALQPGGRFVGELGAAGNVGAIVRALDEALRRRGRSFADVSPWFYPTGPEYRARLEAAGFAVVTLEVFERPTPLPGDITAWLETFAGAFQSALSDPARAALFAELRAALAPTLQRPDGTWWVDYVRLRFHAVKPG